MAHVLLVSGFISMNAKANMYGEKEFILSKKKKQKKKLYPVEILNKVYGKNL